MVDDPLAIHHDRGLSAEELRQREDPERSEEDGAEPEGPPSLVQPADEAEHPEEETSRGQEAELEPAAVDDVRIIRGHGGSLSAARYASHVKVEATPAAEAVVRKVAESGRDELVLVLGTGCCDSTAPFLYDRYYPGPDAVRVGEIAGVPILAHAWLAKLYAEGDGLVVDADDGVLSDSFSLESELGCRFTLRVAADERASS